MLTAIKSANGFALAAAATLSLSLPLSPPLSFSLSLSLSPVPLPSSPPLPGAAQLHCNPWQRRGPEKPQWRPKTSKWLPAGECGWPPPSLPLSTLSFPLSTALLAVQKDVRSILWFCKRLSHRILFALRIGHTPRPPMAAFLPPPAPPTFP